MQMTIKNPRDQQKGSSTNLSLIIIKFNILNLTLFLRAYLYL